MAPVELTERLFVPHRKRLSQTYVTNEDGVRELRIDYGVKEITFDEERLFPFGEQIVREVSFTGEDAVSWGPGYTWEEIQPLLQALLAEGVLKRGERFEDPRGGGLVASALPPSQCSYPRFWSLAECESIMQDLAGHAVEIGYIESVIPISRIAHPALDADGRQVGEGNVFPRSLRLDLETEWRVCQYSGSRYRDETPMNVTALKAMIKYWKPMMYTIREVCSELRARLGMPVGRWTIGELHTMSCVVLALPAFLLMKGGGTSPQRPLHPVLSSLFRITDGIRMVTSAILFRVEQPRSADEPMNGAQLFTHAEQNGTFIGHTGVCAGPKPLIDEFLGIAIDGVPPPGLEGLVLAPEIEALLGELPTAIDYGLYALQSWGVSLCVWLSMTQAYEQLLRVFETVEPRADAEGWTSLRDRLDADWPVFEALQITLDHDRDVHMKFYRDAYERSWRGARTPIGHSTLAEEIAPGPVTPVQLAAADQLRSLLGARFFPGEPVAESPVERIVQILLDYVRAEQRVLESVTQFQDTINALLDRPSPKRPLCVEDFRAHFSLASGIGAFPYLFESIEKELGIRLDCTAREIDISDRGTS
jgi:hypothetical protein